MLLKPVTALTLTALVSFASFTASSAMAAPNPAADSSVSVSSSTVKGAHPSKKTGKKPVAKRKAAVASLHSVEPKESPKIAMSLTAPLDLRNASDLAAASTKTAAASGVTTVAAATKEVFIGGKAAPACKPGLAVKTEKAGLSDGGDTPASVATSSSKLGHKVALGPLHASKSGPMAKSGRAPSRPDSTASKIVDDSATADDHPVLVALRGDAKADVKTQAVAPHIAISLPAGGVAVAVMPVTSSAPVAPGKCLHDPIEFVRGAETSRFAMTRCDGTSAPLAVEKLSVLVRPENAPLPASIADLAKVKGQDLAPGVRRIDPGLLARLQVITDHFAKPGQPPRIAIISGYRPASSGSYHASAQALDFHLEGVPNEALVDFCKTLENTGCGFYPNSSFVHVDVRSKGTGHVAWIDTSGPGETPHYVASWPPAPEPDVKVAIEELDMVNPYTEVLPSLPADAHPPTRAADDEKAPAASTRAPLNLKDFE